MCNVCVYMPAPIYSNACTHRKPADPGHNEKCMFLQCRIRCVCVNVSAGLHAASYHQWALPVGTDLSQYRLLFGRLQQEHNLTYNGAEFDIQHSMRLAHGTQVPTLHEVHVRSSPAYLLKWHAADTTTNKSIFVPGRMACGLLTVPLYRHYNKPYSLAGCPAKMACGSLTVPIYRHATHTC